MNRKIRALFVVLIMFVSYLVLCGTPPAQAFSGTGSGTFIDPYIITTAAQLDEIRNAPSASYKLANDISLAGYQNGEGWVPIGTGYLNQFGGTLDGDGHKITDLMIDIPASSTSNYSGVGLFGQVYSPTIKNLVIEAPNITCAKDVHVAALVGTVTGRIEMSNCQVIGGSVINNATTSINKYTGGLIGSAMNADELCDSGVIETTVSSMKSSAGGCFGNLTGGSSITRCYSTAVVSAAKTAGGLVGNTMVDIVQCYATGPVSQIGTSTTSTLGGLAGYMSVGDIQESFSTSDITCNVALTDAHGLVGDAGIIDLTDCYYGGHFISPQMEVSSIASTLCSSTHCYWDSIVSGFPDTGGGGAKLTTGMKKQSSFPDWDFTSVWQIDENQSYPYLRTVPKPAAVVVGASYDVAGGSGTTVDPYFIANAVQLGNMRGELSAYYKLLSDISLSNYQSGEGWMPVGYSSAAAFSGGLDGDGYRITGLVANVPSTSASTYNGLGLFGHVSGATLKNLIIESPSIGCDKAMDIGALAGRASGQTQIDNCQITGGTVAHTYTSTGKYTGGMVGWMEYADQVHNCSVISTNVSSSKYTAGGMLGCINGGTINCCYTTASVTGAACTGGLVGDNKAAISQCFTTGPVTLTATTTNKNGGGLVGYLGQGSISDSFSTSAVTSNMSSSRVGGFLGKYGAGTVTRCYSTGYIDCPGTTYNGFGPSGSDCYWDTETSGVTRSQAGAGKTTAEMAQQATFATWDFTSTWTINENTSYPYLNTLPQPSSVILVGVSSITVAPTSFSLGTGGVQQLTVTAHLSDGTALNVTNSAAYNSNNTDVATVSATGLVTAVDQGNTDIQVGYSGQETSAHVIVAPPLPVPTGLIFTPGANPAREGALSWEVCSGVSGYAIYRNDDGTLVRIPATGIIIDNSYMFTDLTPNTSKAYLVRSVDSAGGESPDSDPLDVNTAAMNPSNLSLVSAGTTSLVFTLENGPGINFNQPDPPTRIEARAMDGTTIIAYSDFSTILTDRTITGLQPNTPYRVFTITRNAVATIENPALEWNTYSTTEPNTTEIDANNRLKKLVIESGGYLHYEYDLNGNLIQKTYISP